MPDSILSSRSFESQNTAKTGRALASFKRAGWVRFHQAPFPKRNDEQWRFSSFSRPEFQNCALATSAPPRELRLSVLERSRLLETAAAVNVSLNGRLLRSGAAELRQNAPRIIFESFEDAAKNHPEALSRFLFRQAGAPLGGEKFLAMNHAYLRNGYVMIVPDGVKLDAPIVSYHWVSGKNRATFPTTLVIAGEETRVSLVDFFLSDNPEKDAALGIAATNIHAAVGSKVTRVAVQDWSARTFSYQFENIRAERDSDVASVSVNLGGAHARLENVVELDGRGARARLHGLSVVSGSQELDQRTLQVHNAPGAYSDLLYKNALLDRSRTIFSGLIRVAPDAQNTDAYQSNRNLLLSPYAKANSLPGLEIGANDVRCSHGATNSPVDDEELFYLQARGLPAEEARELLVFGFFEEIIEKAGDDAVAAVLRRLVREKLAPQAK